MKPEREKRKKPKRICDLSPRDRMRFEKEFQPGQRKILTGIMPIKEKIDEA